MQQEELSLEHAPRTRGRLVFVLIATVTCAAAGYWYWTSRGADAEQPTTDKTVRSTLHLETFVLNLADRNQRSYLRIGVDLGLNRELKRTETVPVAQVRDTILGVLGEAKVDDLMNTAGKTRLKQDLLHALNERMPQLGAQEIYFTEFLIQR